MNQHQKQALAILIAILLVLILSVAATTMGALGVRWLGIALVCLVAVVACAGGILFFRLRPNVGAVAFDERDREIQRNANLTSFSTVYFLLVPASFAPALIAGEEASIPLACLPLIFAGIGVLHACIFFASLLIQYGKQDPGGQP
jgi:hypothetical protein